MFVAWLSGDATGKQMWLAKDELELNSLDSETSLLRVDWSRTAVIPFNGRHSRSSVDGICRFTKKIDPVPLLPSTIRWLTFGREQANRREAKDAGTTSFALEYSARGCLEFYITEINDELPCQQPMILSGYEILDRQSPGSVATIQTC